MNLAPRVEQRVATASVRIGEVTVKNVQIWRSSSRKLRAFFPASRSGRYWHDYVEVPPELRREIDKMLIDAYKSMKEKEKKGNQ